MNLSSRAFRLRVSALLFIIGVNAPSFSLAETHYVSNTGSNTPPYTSWATATDSIRAALEASGPYDTVLVAAGSYSCDSLILKRGMLFQGVGMDSTYVRHNGVHPGLLVLADSSITRGFHFDGIVDTMFGSMLNYHLYSAVSGYADVNALVVNNRFTNAEYVFTLIDNSLNNPTYRVQVDSNEMRGFLQGVFAFGTSTRITNNRFYIQDDDIFPAIDQTNGSAAIIGNRFYKTVVNAGPAIIDLGPVDTIDIRNNLVTCDSGSTGALIWLNRTSSGPVTQGQIVNNTFIGGQFGVFADHADVAITNNLFAFTTLRAVRPEDTLVQYNLFWHAQEGGLPFDTAAFLSLNNQFSDPMFQNTTDYQLQLYSPAINSGQPTIVDIDGTRSDIGYSGGTFGFSYPYEDLPPRAPTVLDGVAESGIVHLHWRLNTESDLLEYFVYRSTSPIPYPDQGSFLASTADTIFADSTVFQNQSYYYRITAVDQQLLESSLSPEAVVVVTGITEPPTIQPVSASLGLGYPNPFNASMNIPLQVTGAGQLVPLNVRVDVYATTGSHVATLMEGSVMPGEQRVVGWNGTSNTSQPCASGTYFIRLTAAGISETRKIMLLK